MAGKNWEYFLPLLYKPLPFSDIKEVRGSILLKCLNQEIPWSEIFKNCSGPYFINNQSVASGKAVLQYTKRNLDRRFVFIIIDEVNSGLESLTIISESNEVAAIFDIASTSCQLHRIEYYNIPENNKVS